MKFLLHLLKFIFVDGRYFIALGLRLFMVILSEVLYYKYNFIYTDIDYHVFSDGAKHMMNFESPYNRETYRYTPLLALLIIPNHIINYNFGKVLFSIIDVLVGLLIEILLNIQNCNKKDKTPEYKMTYSAKDIFKQLYSYIDNPYAYTSLIYLYNPFTINICTRGSADCIITFLVILTLIFIEIGFFPLAGIVYGFAIHFKIYPLIYAPALYLYLISKDVHIKKIFIEDENEISKPIYIPTANDQYSVVYYFNLGNYLFKKTIRKTGLIIKVLLKSIFHFKAITFAFLTIATFVLFLFLFYILYGNKFLYEYFLYHLVRKDHRHNYSIFYYLIYLTYASSLSKLLSFITFVPQVLLIILSTIFLFQNINLCLLVLTMIFVTFNKVVTAQYFLWYICLIPLVVPYNKLFDIKKHGGRVLYGVCLFLIWLFFELIWNGFSHRLEYKGENLFLEIWGINVIFFCANCVIIKEFIVSHRNN